MAPQRLAAAEGAPPLGFDALEFDRYTELHVLSMELAESASDLSAVSAEVATSLGDFDGDLTRLGRLSSDLQNRLMRLRMVPLSQLSSRLHRAVRATAEQEGKLVELAVEGETVELDKTVLEALADPLLHLLRNAVAHGIEPAALRRAVGKSERGRIHVQASQEGTQVTVRVSDDGVGMDAQALGAAAVASGHLAAAEAAALSYDQAIELAFLPGLSTAGALSEVSGRGVGLDVVRAGAQRANGTVSVRSTPGHGTTFAIRLPMTLSVARVLMVRAGGESFAVPLSAVAQILRVERTAIERIDGSPVLSLDGRSYPYLHLGDRLRLTPGAEASSPQMPVLILALGDRRAALAVDQVGQAREVVAKSLGPLLRRVSGISGATLTGDGEVVLIVNPGELVGEEGDESSAVAAWPAGAPSASAGAEASRALQVLVVDDSLSVRRVLANLLRGVGWNPVPARDGLEALELLEGADQAPDAILLDIEMPRMDGYELTARLRGMPEFAAVPIVILTSRAGEKHRRRAFELGATDYLVKPYEDATLVATVRRVTRKVLPA
jgi:chemosensory pili system protein ChpA (sensor histidine kinase/response regulator)